MSCQCKGLCDREKSRVFYMKCGFWNQEDASRCTKCEIRLITKRIKCYCCHSKLSKNPRSKRSKDRLR